MSRAVADCFRRASGTVLGLSWSPRTERWVLPGSPDATGQTLCDRGIRGELRHPTHTHTARTKPVAGPSPAVGKSQAACVQGRVMEEVYAVRDADEHGADMSPCTHSPPTVQHMKHCTPVPPRICLVWWSRRSQNTSDVNPELGCMAEGTGDWTPYAQPEHCSSVWCCRQAPRAASCVTHRLTVSASNLSP